VMGRGGTHLTSLLVDPSDLFEFALTFKTG
jgi:hypothetical protein